MKTTKTSLSRRRFNAVSLMSLAGATAGIGLSKPALAQALMPKSGGTLRIARAEEIDGFKLDSELSDENNEVSQNVIAPLLRYDSSGLRVVPGLAESFVVAADGKSITFQLAMGARFSTGKPVTTDDVIFSVNQWKAGPNFGSMYVDIASVTKLSDTSFRFNLSAPNLSLPAFLTWSVAGIIPDNFAGMKADQFWLTPIGAGAFSVKSWEGMGNVHLVKNPYYYRPGLPYVDEILSTLPDANQRALQFQAGEVDIVSELGPIEARRYPKSKLIESEVHYTDVLLFNIQYAPLQDIRLRKAIAMAVDYKAIVDGLYRGLAIEPTGFLPPNVGMWQPPSKPYYRQNIAMAKALMKEAGITTIQLELLFPPNYTLVSQIVQQSLQAIGVDVKLNPTDSGTFVSDASAGKFQLAIWAYNAISPNIGDPLSWITSTSYFFTNYPMKDLQAAANELFISRTPEEEKAAVIKIQDLGSSELAFLALDHYKIGTAVQSNIHGVTPPPWANIYYDEIWIS